MKHEQEETLELQVACDKLLNRMIDQLKLLRIMLFSPPQSEEKFSDLRTLIKIEKVFAMLVDLLRYVLAPVSEEI